MEILRYMLQVTLCWSLFYGIYYFLLRQVTFHRANRWFLLGSLLMGLILPLLRYISIDWGQTELSAQIPVVSLISTAPDHIVSVVADGTLGWIEILSYILMAVYGIGVVAGLTRLFKSLVQIRRLYATGAKTHLKDYTIVRTGGVHLPFSFLRTVYLSSEMPLSDEYDDVMRHELTHIRSRHSIDVLLVELVAIVFWFHPLVYLYKAAIRQTHEYLADHAAILTHNKKKYSTMLLQQSMSGLEVALAHHFFHSHIKKRINMMYQKQSGPSAWLKYALALPVLFILVLSCTTQANEKEPTALVAAQVKSNESNQDEVFKVVDQMPTFPGCDDVADHKERKACADKKLLTYLYKNVKYPEEARKNDIQGRSYVGFVVNKDGSLSDISIMRPLDPSIDKEVVRVVESMNAMEERWAPGVHNGKLVRVRYVLPVVFKLADDTNDSKPSKASLPKDIFKVTDIMPMFPGCDDVVDHKERKACSDELLLKYLYENIKYPKEGRAAKTEGRSYVQFVVNPSGDLSDIKILRSLGPAFDKEVLRVVRSMNNMDRKWSSGEQGGQKVKVAFTLPVAFKLTG